MKLANPADNADITRVLKLRPEHRLLRRSAGEAKRSSHSDLIARALPQAPRTEPRTARPVQIKSAPGYRGALRSLIIILKSLLIVAIVMPLSILTLMMCILSIEWIVFEEIRMNFLM